MNTNYAAATAATLLSLPVVQLKQATHAFIKSSLANTIQDKHSILNESNNLNQGSTIVVNTNTDGKNLKSFLNDLQSVFKEQRDEGLKSIVSDQHKKGGSQEQSSNMQQSQDSEGQSIKHRQCTINDFLTNGNKLVCTDESALLDVINANIPLHLRQALAKGSVAPLPEMLNSTVTTLSLDDLDIDLQTLKLTLKIVCAIDEAMRISSAVQTVNGNSRYYFDQSYMPYLYLLLFKSYALKEKLKKEKTRYSDSLYRKKSKDEQAQKENHMSLLL